MEFIEVGFTKKAHSLTGELKVNIEPRYLEDVLKADVVFIETKGTRLPHFIERIREGREILVKFEEVNNRTEAEALQSKKIFLRETDILADDEREIELETLEYEFAIGWKLVDATLGELGKIERVEEFPQQEMAVILWKGNEAMIPLNEAFLVEIDEENETIKVDLPDGPPRMPLVSRMPCA